jgi:hypothetical protein
MGAATGPGMAADPERGRGIRIPVLCVIASLGAVHAGLGVGLLIADRMRGDEFFTLVIFAALLLFVMPGLLIATLAGDALMRSARRAGGVMSRKHYVTVAGVLIVLSALLGMVPLHRWHSVLFIAPACLLLMGGALVLAVKAQRA